MATPYLRGGTLELASEETSNKTLKPSFDALFVVRIGKDADGRVVHDGRFLAMEDHMPEEKVDDLIRTDDIFRDLTQAVIFVRRQELRRDRSMENFAQCRRDTWARDVFSTGPARAS